MKANLKTIALAVVASLTFAACAAERRFGYEEVACDYRLAGAPVTLMVKPIRGTAEIAPVAHRILRDLYSRVLSGEKLDKTVDIRRV